LTWLAGDLRHESEWAHCRFGPFPILFAADIIFFKRANSDVSAKDPGVEMAAGASGWRLIFATHSAGKHTH
jgi:hypothetical protein